ncbi:TPA: type-F conjugative transfer system pilin acetylase TraX [Escherichia coli]
MMSIAQVRSAGSAGNYYTDKDNYYVLGSMGERWAGRGAEQLGLQGSVDKDVFTRLLEGKLPDGADLSRMQDGSNKHRPGYDLTFSAPKSVSVMAMLGGDKRLIDAHNQAVDFAVRQVWGLNLSRHTHIRQEAINRLWGWAVIAQFAYYLAGFPWYEGNILFAFAVAAQVLTWCETRTWWRSAETMLLLAMWLPFSGTSYGIAGLLMLAVSHRLYRAEDRMERLALVACLLAVIPALNLATSDAAAVAGLVMTVLTVGLVSCTGKSLPRFWYGDFFPTFYACHLTVLGVLAV